MSPIRASSLRFLNLLASLALLVATFFVYSSLLRPEYVEVNQLRGDLASKSVAVAEQGKIVEKYNELLDKYPNLSNPQGLQRIIGFALPNEEDYPTLVNQIRGLAVSARLNLQSVSFNLLPFSKSAGAATQNIKNVPLVGIIQLRMNVSGSYQDFKIFLQDLERNVRIMDVVSLAVSPGAGPSLDFNLTVNAYYQTLQ